MSIQPQSAQPEIISHLSSKGLIPRPAWLSQILSTLRPTPLPALKKTIEFRLFASDFTHTLEPSPASTFPADLIAGNPAPSRNISGPTPVQILDVDDVGKSKWSQIEALDAVQRGETRRGHEVIRVVPGEDGLEGERSGTTGDSAGPHRLLLQDANGMRIWAFELSPISGISTSMSIGAKLVLRNVVVNRGVAMLDLSTCTCLGGKIDEMDKKWKEGRRERLLKEVQREDG